MLIKFLSSASHVNINIISFVQLITVETERHKNTAFNPKQKTTIDGVTLKINDVFGFQYKQVLYHVSLQ